jgi:hypothetical protein
LKIWFSDSSAPVSWSSSSLAMTATDNQSPCLAEIFLPERPRIPSVKSEATAIGLVLNGEPASYIRWKA